jgi:hypothetical protein
MCGYELNQKYQLFLLNCCIDYWFFLNPAFDSLQILFRFLDFESNAPIVSIKEIRALLGNEFLEGVTMSEHPEDGLICFSLHVCTFKTLLSELHLESTLNNFLSLYNLHPLIGLINGVKRSDLAKKD